MYLGGRRSSVSRLVRGQQAQWCTRKDSVKLRGWSWRVQRQGREGGCCREKTSHDGSAHCPIAPALRSARITWAHFVGAKDLLARFALLIQHRYVADVLQSLSTVTYGLAGSSYDVYTFKSEKVSHEASSRATPGNVCYIPTRGRRCLHFDLPLLVLTGRQTLRVLVACN